MLYISLILLFGLFFKYRGGGFDFLGTQEARMIWTIPFTILVSVLYQNVPLITPFYVFSLIIFIFIFLGLLLGHGAHMVMGRGTSFKKEDRTEMITTWLPVYQITTPFIQRWLIDFVGLSFIYLVRFLLIIIPILITTNSFSILISLVIIPLPALGYSFGWWVQKYNQYFYPTVIGEFLTGCSLSLGIMIPFLI